MRNAKLEVRPGFDWSRVAWGRPESPRRPLCAYCHAGIGEEEVPLMLWKPDGSGAQFCDECAERWFGVKGE
jgi:hypothetical protein